MRYHPYESYSQPEVDWLDEIPSHWEIRRTKTLLSLQKSKVGLAASEYTLLSLTLGGVVPRNISEGGKFPAEFDTYQKVERGDLVFCLFDIDETPRTIGIARDDGMITGAYNVYRALPPCVPEYAYYYFLHIDSFKGLRPFYTGLRKVVRADTFSKIEMPAPPLEEQTQIAKFLDYETAKIDALIAKQQQLIALLQEKRQAVISHAVTKGLNPDAPLRDSGVEWLGKVPAHWMITPIKYLCYVNDGNHGEEYPKDSDSATKENGVPFIRAGDFKNFKIIEDDLRYISREKNNSMRKGNLQENDILFVNRGATIGKIGVIDKKYVGSNLNSQIAYLRVDESIFSHRFLMYYLSGTFIQETVTAAIMGGALPQYPINNIVNLDVCHPSLNEQQVVVAYLDSVNEALDSLEAGAERVIKLLQERRTALIAAAVTGKIDVRGWQPPLAAAAGARA